MKIQKGHYVPKELITSEVIHEAVVKCFVAAGFKAVKEKWHGFNVEQKGIGLAVDYDGIIAWLSVADNAITLQQLFTAENWLQWPDFATEIRTDDNAVWFFGGGHAEHIFGSIQPVPHRVLATRQPKEKEEGLTQTSSSETISLISTTWWDYENQKALRLPDVGEKVLFSCGQTYFVVAHHCNRDDVVIGSEFERSGELKYLAIIKCKPLDHATRKAEMEKKMVVDAAIDAAKIGRDKSVKLNPCVEYAIERLYDAGYLRLPDQK